MDMKKILLSMILLALCLIQASADTYYFQIQLSDENGQPGGWSNYIKVDAVDNGKVVNGVKQYDYPNGLRTLLNGGTVTVEDNENLEHTYTLPKKAGKVDLDRIYGIAFANGKGKFGNKQENILEGDEYEAWKLIRERIKYLELRKYKHATHTNNGYFMNMSNLEELELPKDGMTVGNGDDDCNYYFANALKLKRIIIWSDKKQDHVDITDDAVKDKPLYYPRKS